MTGLPGLCRGCGARVWWDGWSWRTPHGVHACPRKRIANGLTEGVRFAVQSKRPRNESGAVIAKVTPRRCHISPVCQYPGAVTVPVAATEPTTRRSAGAEITRDFLDATTVLWAQARARWRAITAGLGATTHRYVLTREPSYGTHALPQGGRVPRSTASGISA